MYARGRLDALSDGLFAVAMTLLVLDIRLPDDFQPADGGALIRGLVGLWPKLLPYALSFGVLGLRWLSNIEVRSHAEFVGRDYVNWWLLYLFLITCLPFSTIVLGRFGNLAPAIWLYSGHTLMIAAVGLRMLDLTPDLEPGHHLNARIWSSRILAASSVLAIAVSFVSAHLAPWAFVLNFAAPVIRRYVWPPGLTPPHPRDPDQMS